jgi:serine/threonine protein phosphatase 1
LGDFIDRGPHSAGVISRILQLRKAHRLTAIMGNHEERMLGAREGSGELTMWLSFGGYTVLESYFGPQPEMAEEDYWLDLLHQIPKDHWTFLESDLVPYVETDTHIFVHAAAEADLDMPEQFDTTLRWTKCQSMAPHHSGKTVLCGHTSQKSGRPLNAGHYICLDTHAYGGKPLTAMDVHSGRVWQAHADGNVLQSQIDDYQ